MKVLVVDDSESIRELVGTVLENAGYQVNRCVDGLDAIHSLGRYQADLVITDLNMPNMDGLSLLKEIRNNKSFIGLPVLMLTTESQQNKKIEAKDAGATGWIVKPFEQERLLSIVKRVLR